MAISEWAAIAAKMLGALPLAQPAPPELPEALSAATAEATCAPDWGIDDCVPIWPLKKRGKLMATTIAVGYFESGFLERIGAGRCRKDECDAVKLPGGRIVHLANGYWQLHRTGLATADEWREARGREAWPTFVQARIAIRVLATAQGKCRSSGESDIGAAISGFATGGRCWWPGTRVREGVANRLMKYAPGA